MLGKKYIKKRKFFFRPNDESAVKSGQSNFATRKTENFFLHYCGIFACLVCLGSDFFMLCFSGSLDELTSFLKGGGSVACSPAVGRLLNSFGLQTRQLAVKHPVCLQVICLLMSDRGCISLSERKVLQLLKCPCKTKCTKFLCTKIKTSRFKDYHSDTSLRLQRQFYCAFILAL